MRLGQQHGAGDALGLKLVEYVAHDMQPAVLRCDKASLAKAGCIGQACQRKVAVVPLRQQVRAVCSQHSRRSITDQSCAFNPFKRQHLRPLLPSGCAQSANESWRAAG